MELVLNIHEHAAQLIGETPWRVSRSEDLLYAALSEAYRCYGYAPVVVGIDIYNVEPEAYGARVQEPAETGVPHISSPIRAGVRALYDLPFFDPLVSGRMPLLLAVGRRLQQAFPAAEVRIPMSGPVSIAGHLLGLEGLLMAMLDDPAGVRAALRHLAEGQLRWCAEIARQGLRCMVYDSSAAPPMVSPPLFREIVFPVLREMLAEIALLARERVPLIIGGDTAAIAPLFPALATDYLICPAETDQQALLDALAPYPALLLRVNMRSGMIASSDRHAVGREIARLLRLVQGRSRVCLGTGIIPYGTPPASVRHALAVAGNGDENHGFLRDDCHEE